MLGNRPRCSVSGCRSECLHPFIAAPIVVLACSLALYVPLLGSTGFKLTEVIARDPKFTYLSVLIGLAWIASILISCLRRHEDIVNCFLDSFGIPGLVTAVVYADAIR